MNETTFKYAMYGVALIFTVLFFIIVIPALIQNPNVIEALAAGFVNPFASGYSSDVILCWMTLAVWVIYEAKVYAVKKGWICLVLGLFPGVAVGFPLYLVLRNNQIKQAKKS